jgi:hypothetical protein
VCNLTEATCCGGRCVGSASAVRFCEGCGFQGGFPQGCAPDEACDRGVCVAAPSAGAARTVTAEAACQAGAVTVEVANRVGRRLYVGFARATANAAGTVADVAIERGATDSLALPTSPGAAAADGALVVTSAGVLRPRCGGRASIDIGPRPPAEAERRAEWPAIAARTIAGLEADRAFDALYALLHLDAKGLVSEAQMACWYAGYLGGMTAGEVTVRGVAFGPWTWGGNGKTYAEAAEVACQQTFYVDGVPTDHREGMEHLVLDAGQWRWFLGSDPAFLAGLPSTCAPG